MRRRRMLRPRVCDTTRGSWVSQAGSTPTYVQLDPRHLYAPPDGSPGSVPGDAGSSPEDDSGFWFDGGVSPPPGVILVAGSGGSRDRRTGTHCAANLERRSIARRCHNAVARGPMEWRRKIKAGTGSPSPTRSHSAPLQNRSTRSAVRASAVLPSRSRSAGRRSSRGRR